MTGALQESKCGALGDSGQTGEQQASNRAAPPEREGVERQKPERGLTLEARRPRSGTDRGSDDGPLALEWSMSLRLASTDGLAE